MPRLDGAWIPLVEGVYQFEVTSHGDTSGELDLFLADENGYLLGSAIQNHATDLGTLAHPSTADSAIGTGAYVANFDLWDSPGDLAFYSGRGPRIDGELGVDIVGPADGMAAESGGEGPFPSMANAAGTSGSLPQVTGVVALLKQLDPSLTSDEVLARLQAGAIADGSTGTVPNPSWGYGKLSAFRSLLQTAPWENQGPSAIIDAPETAYYLASFSLSAAESVDPDDPSDTLKVRWDVGYNGNWTLPTGIDEPLIVPKSSGPGMLSVVVEIYDPLGAFQRVLINVERVETPPPDVGPEQGADSGSESDDSPVEAEKTVGSAGCAECSTGGGGPPPTSLLLVLVYFLLYRRRTRSAMRGSWHATNTET